MIEPQRLGYFLSDAEWDTVPAPPIQVFWIPWELADGRWIVISPEFQEEVAGPFASEAAAHKDIADRMDAWSERAWERRNEALMESGGVDDSKYRQDIRDAGRAHLLR